MSGPLLAGLGVAMLATGGMLWVRWIRRVEFGEKGWILSALVAGAAALAAASVATGPGLAGGVAAGLVGLVGLAWLVLRRMARQSTQAPLVAVGDALPDFSAPDENGEPFELARLRGRPLLIKFFRGHW